MTFRYLESTLTLDQPWINITVSVYISEDQQITIR